jgi:hypothetical protein
MITFNVVREQHGWAIRMGERMSMHFRSKDMAVREASCLAAAILRHGGSAEVIMEEADPAQPLNEIKGAHSSRIDVSSRQMQSLGFG